MSTTDEQLLTQHQRGNLTGQALRKIIVLTDVFPDPALPAFEEMLGRMEQAQIELIFMPFFPDDSLGTASNFAERQTLFEKGLVQFAGLASKRIHIFPARSNAQLADNVVPKIMNLGKELAIRS